MNEAKSLPSWKSQLKSHYCQYGDGGDGSAGCSGGGIIAKMPTSIPLVFKKMSKGLTLLLTKM